MTKIETGTLIINGVNFGTFFKVTRDGKEIVTTNDPGTAAAYARAD